MIVIEDFLQRNESKWLSANVPLTVRLSRQDWQLSNLSELSSTQWIAFFIVIQPGQIAQWDAEFPVGGKAWIKSGHNSFEVTVADRVVSNTPYIIFDKPASAQSVTVGGYANSFERKNWRMVLRSVKTGLVITDLRYTFRPDGVMEVDLRKHLEDFVSLEDVPPVTGVNYPDNNISNVAAFSYQELYTGFTGTLLFYQFRWFVNNALQLGDENDGNLLAYYPLNDSRKFLHPGGALTYFNGFRFDLSFIYPEEFRGWDVRRRIRQTLQDGTTTIQDAIVDRNHIGRVNRAPIDAVYGPNVKFVDVALFLIGSAERLRNTYAENYANDYTTEERIKATTTGQITEWRRLIPVQCTSNAIQLKWRNKLGGMSYYVFQFRQLVDLDVDSFEVFESVVRSISDSKAKSKPITKVSRDQFTVGCTWSATESDAYSDLFDSPYVALVESGLEVKIEAGNYRIKDTRENRQEIEFTFAFDDKYNQRR